MSTEDGARSAAFARLLSPSSVAIVGASDKPGSLGASVLGNLTRMGFDGAIHLVNPKRQEIGGRPCLSSVAKLPEGIDVAVLAIPRAGVLDSLRELGKRRVGAAIIFSAGFAEGGAEGQEEQLEIGRIARESNMLVEGPNCLGMINMKRGVPLTFVEIPGKLLGERAGIGIVSQSGAMGAVLATTLLSRDLGVSFMVSTGNEADTGVEDYVSHLVEDPDTRVIAMVVEQFRRPAAFLAAAERARAAGKPLVLLHPGRSAAARESAVTHTGALAGDWQVMQLKVARAGVTVVRTLEELGDVSELLLRCPPMIGGGTVVLTESGAWKALTLDLAEDVGLALPRLDDENAPALRKSMPPFVAVSNPVDLTAQPLVDPDIYRRTIETLLPDERFSSILLSIIQTDPATSKLKFPPIIQALAGMTRNKPVIFAGVDDGAEVPAEYIAGLREIGVPWFPTTERAIRAITVLAERARRDLSVADASGAPTGGFLGDDTGIIPEYRAKALLGPLGIPFPEGRLATELADARVAAAELGYPVVLKAQSSELSHKSDVGGVILGIEDESALEAAWAGLVNNVARSCPDLELDGVLIEAMGEKGVELIVGARHDPEWGPVVLVGFGGVQAELMRDIRLLAPDLTHHAILSELDKLKGAPLLHGYRGSRALDRDAVARLIATVGRALLVEPRIREIDLNPVVVYPEGQGVQALDALMDVG